MVPSCKIVGIAFALTFSAAAQDVAPDALARIKIHMRNELSSLPNYTCLESITRFQSEVRRRLEPLDRAHVEIVYSGHQEWYGLPGARSLSAESPRQFVGGGMMGTGAFAITLGNILSGAATITFRGQELLDGKIALKYDYLLRALVNRFRISLPGGSGIVGQQGSFWADPSSLDFVRLESNASEIPPTLPLTFASVNLNYARVRIGDRDVLAPQRADLHMAQSGGEEAFDRLEFTHCRVFLAQSSVSFEPEPQGPEKTPSAKAALPSAPAVDDQIPEGLLITGQLTTPITEKDAVGKPIEARVMRDVRAKGKVLIPSGSLVRGRIRRLEPDSGEGTETGALLLALEFTDVEAGGEQLPFYADLLRIDRTPGVRPAFFERVSVPCGEGGGCRAGAATITLPQELGVASFSVSGKTLTAINGLRMVWRTREPTTEAVASGPVLR